MVVGVFLLRAVAYLSDVFRCVTGCLVGGMICVYMCGCIVFMGALVCERVSLLHVCACVCSRVCLLCLCVCLGVQCAYERSCCCACLCMCVKCVGVRGCKCWFCVFWQNMRRLPWMRCAQSVRSSAELNRLLLPTEAARERCHDPPILATS